MTSRSVIRGYKLIGDSVNVDVVAKLLHFLIFEWSGFGRNNKKDA